ncbi:hypothetical protein EFT49_05550 [Leuconostoc falkenbergense]|nr:hypothetical protein [Leuconostoc falkenbergense]
MYSMTVHKMFKKSFIDSHNFTMNENVRHGEEDKLFMVQTYVSAKVISILSDYDYYYVIDFEDGSNSHKTTPIGDPKKHMLATELSIEYIINHAQQPQILYAYLKRMAKHSIWRKGLYGTDRTYDQNNEFYNQLSIIFRKYFSMELLNDIHYAPGDWLFKGLMLGNFEQFNELYKSLSNSDFSDVVEINKNGIYVENTLINGSILAQNFAEDTFKIEEIQKNGPTNLSIRFLFYNKLLYNTEPSNAMVTFSIPKTKCLIKFPVRFETDGVHGEADVDINKIINAGQNANWYGNLELSYGGYNKKIRLSQKNNTLSQWTGKIENNSMLGGETTLKVTDKGTLMVMTQVTTLNPKTINTMYRLPDLQREHRVFLFGLPQHTNLGDHAISYAEKKFVEKYLHGYQLVEILRNDTKVALMQVKERIIKGDIILMTGGGNMGSIYKTEEYFRSLVVETFANNKNVKLIIMPQTIHFDGPNDPAIEAQQNVYNNINNLLIVAREKMSFERFKKIFPETKIILTPDIVLSLNERPQSQSRSGLLLVLRRDKEKTTNEKIIQSALKQFDFHKITKTDTSLMRKDLIITGKNRMVYLKQIWDSFRESELVITDRLHGIIFAFITGTPVVAFDNSTHKIKNSYFDWLFRFENVQYIDNNAEIDELVEKIKIVRTAGASYEYNDDFGSEYKEIINYLRS